jgi:hypothetical protein
MSEAEVTTLAEILKRVESKLDSVAQDVDELKSWKNKAQGAIAVLMLIEVAAVAAVIKAFI